MVARVDRSRHGKGIAGNIRRYPLHHWGRPLLHHLGRDILTGADLRGRAAARLASLACARDGFARAFCCAGRCGSQRRTASLLDRMGQFVREQLLPGWRFGRVAAGGEHDVLAERIGLGPEFARRLGSGATGVDAYSAEVVAEARLELIECRLRQRRTAAL